MPFLMYNDCVGLLMIHIASSYHYKFVYFYQHWFTPCLNKYVSGHVFIGAYTDDTYDLLFIARNSQGEFILWRFSFTQNVDSTGPLPRLCCVESLMLPFFNEMHSTADDKHLNSITAIRIYIAELKTIRSWWCLQAKVSPTFDSAKAPPWYKQTIFQCDTPIGHFGLTFYAQVHCKSLAEARFKALKMPQSKSHWSLKLPYGKCFCHTPFLAWCN